MKGKYVAVGGIAAGIIAGYFLFHEPEGYRNKKGISLHEAPLRQEAPYSPLAGNDPRIGRMEESIRRLGEEQDSMRMAIDNLRTGLEDQARKYDRASEETGAISRVMKGTIYDGTNIDQSFMRYWSGLPTEYRLQNEKAFNHLRVASRVLTLDGEGQRSLFREWEIIYLEWGMVKKFSNSSYPEWCDSQRDHKLKLALREIVPAVTPDQERAIFESEK